MGWENRDYAQEHSWRDAPNFGGVRLPTGAVRVLIILHVVTFIATIVMRGDLNHLSGYLNGITSSVDASPLTILLHPYTPTSPEGGALGAFFKTLFTVSVLWLLGRTIVNHAETKRMLVTYFVGNFIAGALYWVFSKLVPQLTVAPLDYPMGAFAAWSLFAIRDLKFEFAPVFTKFVPIATITWFIVGFTALMELFRWWLGATGLIVVAAFSTVAWFLAPGIERLFSLPARSRKARKNVVRPSVPRSPSRDAFDAISEEDFVAAVARETKVTPPKKTSSADDPELDRILAKISKQGIGSLTVEEREQLESARQAKLKQETR
ncbi:MAG: DUF6576 domain-containing protein [Phycisphaerae bacterium]